MLIHRTNGQEGQRASPIYMWQGRHAIENKRERSPDLLCLAVRAQVTVQDLRQI